MTLPTNGDFENRELSIEELDAIAAGGWLSDALHYVEHKAAVGFSWLGSHMMEVANTVYQYWQQRSAPPSTTTVNRR